MGINTEEYWRGFGGTFRKDAKKGSSSTRKWLQRGWRARKNIKTAGSSNMRSGWGVYELGSVFAPYTPTQTLSPFVLMRICASRATAAYLSVGNTSAKMANRSASLCFGPNQ